MNEKIKKILIFFVEINEYRSHSEFEDYVFSDEEDDEESGQENEDVDEDDENMVGNEKPIKKEVVSFKKKKNSITANALLKMVRLFSYYFSIFKR